MPTNYCCFSEPIRDGAKLRPQAFGFRITRDGKTCAEGAGAEAMGIADISESGMEIARRYPYLSGSAKCPETEACPNFNYSRSKIITHLNDVHHWTREAIADWLFLEEEKLGFVTVYEEINLTAMMPETAMVGR